MVSKGQTDRAQAGATAASRNRKRAEEGQDGCNEV